MADSPELIWIVAAGTGGHIFPGVALAQELRRRRPELRFAFFGTQDRLEAKLVPEAGFPLVTLSAQPWKGKNPLVRIKGLFLLAANVFSILARARRERPALLVSVGGYVSMPVAIGARLAGVPLFLVEPNIRAGVANILLSRLAEKAFTSPGSDALAKFSCPVVDSGNPTREGFGPKEIAPEVKSILVLGGSQGAKALCEIALRAYAALDLEKHGIRLTLQSGSANLDFARGIHQELKLGPQVEILPFISNVAERVGAADLVVARAGATTVSELSLTGVPTIFVPFPFAADDHQRMNVKLLVADGAARMVDEKAPEPLARLKEGLDDLVLRQGHFARRRALREAFVRWGRPRALATLSEEVLSRISRKG